MKQGNCSYFEGCPRPPTVISPGRDNTEFPAENVLTDQCDAAGTNEWRKDDNQADLVIVLGCKQDVKSFLIKNGNHDYQTETFAIYVATHSKGPWNLVLEGFLNYSKEQVMYACDIKESSKLYRETVKKKPPVLIFPKLLGSNT